MNHENKMRKILDSGKGSVATRIYSRWPVTVEALASTGKYDYVQFLGEYAPFDQYFLEDFARVTELTGLGSMIKLDYMNRAYVAQKSLASGIESILFADHRTVEDVEETLKFVTPECPQYGNGQLGFAFRRWRGYWGLSPQLDFAQMASESVKAFMVEKQSFVDAIDEICSIKGVDMLQYGPCDYAMSNGYNVKDEPQKIKETELKIFKAADKYGVAVCAELMDCSDKDQIKYYLDLGVKHFNVGMELLAMEDFWKREGSVLLEEMDKAGVEVQK